MNGEDFKALLELQDRVQKSYKRVSIVACTANRPNFSSTRRPAQISFGLCSYMVLQARNRMNREPVGVIW
jgi:hypothetical protein